MHFYQELFSSFESRFASLLLPPNCFEKSIGSSGQVYNITELIFNYLGRKHNISAVDIYSLCCGFLVLFANRPPKLVRNKVIT